MDLDLSLVEITIPQRVSATAEYVRDLTPADIKLLAVKEGKPGDAPIGLTRRMTTRHHALARALSQGMPNWQAGVFVGYDETYVSILRADPTFANLIEFYKEQKAFDEKDFAVESNQLARDAMNVIRDKLDDPDERAKITISQALEIAKFGADRSGYGPQAQTNHKHEHTINMADRMQAARKRVDEARLVDITPQKDDAA